MPGSQFATSGGSGSGALEGREVEDSLLDFLPQLASPASARAKTVLQIITGGTLTLKSSALQALVQRKMPTLLHQGNAVKRLRLVGCRGIAPGHSLAGGANEWREVGPCTGV